MEFYFFSFIFCFIRRICFDVDESEKKACLNSVEFQLVSFSWPNDQTHYAIELVIFTTDEGDGYSEHIYEVDFN